MAKVDILATNFSDSIEVGDDPRECYCTAEVIKIENGVATLNVDPSWSNCSDCNLGVCPAKVD